MLDSYADQVIAIALVASFAGTAVSLRHRIHLRAAREVLGDPAWVAATATSCALGIGLATTAVGLVLWFAAIATDGFLRTVSPLLFAVWLVLLFTATRECLRGVLLLTGCAPTGAAAP